MVVKGYAYVVVSTGGCSSLAVKGSTACAPFEINLRLTLFIIRCHDITDRVEQTGQVHVQKNLRVRVIRFLILISNRQLLNIEN